MNLIKIKEFLIDYIDNILSKIVFATILKYKRSYKKDLSRLNRDLSKMLIIDNVKDNFQLQPDNGLHIKDFYDDVNDSELIEILPYLIGIQLLN